MCACSSNGSKKYVQANENNSTIKVNKCGNRTTKDSLSSFSKRMVGMILPSALLALLLPLSNITSIKAFIIHPLPAATTTRNIPPRYRYRYIHHTRLSTRKNVECGPSLMSLSITSTFSKSKRKSNLSKDMISVLHLSSSSQNMEDAGKSSKQASTTQTKSCSPSVAKTKSKSIQEAEELRQKARVLMAEANMEEEELRRSKLSIQYKKEKELDSIIDEFMTLVTAMDVDGTQVENSDQTTNFQTKGKRTKKQQQQASLSSSPPSQQQQQQQRNKEKKNTEEEKENKLIQLVVNKLRTKNLSTSKLISVVERLYEREMVALGNRRQSPSVAAATATNTNSNKNNNNEASFSIGDTSNSKEYNELEQKRLKGWVDRIINAQFRLEEERAVELEFRRIEIQQSSKEKGESSSTSSTWRSEGQTPPTTVTPTGITKANTASQELSSRIRELRKVDEDIFQRRLATELNSSFGKTASNNKNEDNVQELVRRTLGSDSNSDDSVLSYQNVTIRVDGKEITGSQFNMSRLVANIIQIPMWVPSSLLPFVAVCKDELVVGDLKKIRSEVLMGSQFYCTSWDSIKLAAVYRGDFVQKRTADFNRAMSGDGDNANNKGSNSTLVSSNEVPLSKIVFDDIQKRLKNAGLAEKIQLFMIDDPEWRPGLDGRETEPRPVILALPKSVMPEQGNEGRNGKKVLAGLSIISTLFTTFAYSVSSYALNPTFYNALVKDNNLSVARACIPIFFGVFGLSVIHELAHFVASKKTGIKIGLPIPVPSLQIGTFGNITPLRSFPESRTSLFDLALSGPLVTLVLSMLLMIGGLLLTVQTPSESIAALATVPVAVMKSSFLVGSLVANLAPKIMTLPLSQPIPIHPLFMIGLAGMVSSAVNLLPIGRLDGGRASIALFGRRSAYLISIFTLFFLAISALTGGSTISIFWGLIVTLFQRNAEIPVRDEVTEINDIRYGTYVVSIFLTILILAPFPGGPGAL